MSSQENLKKIKGFTMVEIIIGVVLLGTVVFVLFQLIYSASLTANSETRKALLNQQAKAVLEGIVDEMRQANPETITGSTSIIRLFDSSGADITDDTASDTHAYAIEVVYPGPGGSDIEVGYKVNADKALVKYTPSEPDYVLITSDSKNAYKSVDDFHVVVNDVEDPNRKFSYRKYDLFLTVSEGLGSQKITVTVNTSLVKNKRPS